MNKHLAVLGAVLLLAGCQTPQAVDDATRAVTTACTVVNVASAAFDAYVKANPGRIDDKGLTWKKGVMATVAPICADPASVTDRAKALDTVVKIGFSISEFVSQTERGPRP
jgi:PBP1b-binding outer membrane lipoprotein LpoB